MIVGQDPIGLALGAVGGYLDGFTHVVADDLSKHFKACFLKSLLPSTFFSFLYLFIIISCFFVFFFANCTIWLVTISTKWLK